MVSKEVKRARVTAIVFAILLCVALISMVFGYVQHGLAKRNMKLAEEQVQIAEKRLAQALQYELQAKQAELENKKCQERNEFLAQELIKFKK